jgi:Homeodomain-like domain-containing protein
VSGPEPRYQPVFSEEFLDECRHAAACRSISYSERQRAELALLLDEQPKVSNVAAGTAVGLHPNAVRLWRRRWAAGEFSLADRAGRGRKPTFSPS